VANICTGTPFPRRGEYPQVTSVCKMHLFMGTRLIKEKACCFENVVQKIVEHKYCGACSLHERDGVMTEVSSENLK
jgi:hypothetical protein